MNSHYHMHTLENHYTMHRQKDHVEHRACEGVRAEGQAQREKLETVAGKPNRQLHGHGNPVFLRERRGRSRNCQG